MAQSAAMMTDVPGTHAHAHRQAQVNARIDANLKAAGDAGLAAAGYTPTQAVRALWALAKRCQNDPQKLRAALDPDAEDVADELADRQRRCEAVQRGAEIVQSFFADMGIADAIDPDREGLSDEEYYELLRDEHLCEKGYLA